MKRWDMERERRERERPADRRATGSAGRVRRDERGVGLEAGVEMLLAGLGLLPVHQLDAVSEAARSTIERAGLDAEVRSVRFGTMVIAASGPVAVLLRWHADAVLAACEAACAGAVRELRIVTR